MATAKKRTLTLEEIGEDRELYFETCLRIVPKNAAAIIPFVMKREQRRLAAAIDDCRRRGVPPRIIILKSRRVGASTFSEAELFRMCHTKPHRQALVVAHVADSADTIFKMSKMFYDRLPQSVRPETKYSTKKLIHFDHNDSRMQVVVAGEARGYTAQYLHISELAFVDNAEELMTAILHTAPDDPDSLIIVESTPNGIGNDFHNLWVNAKAGKNDWIPFFTPWYEDETYRMTPWFTEESLSPRDAKMMKDHGLSLEQVAWYISTRENKCNGDQDKMDQENATDDLSCFLASGRKVFDSDGLRHYMDISSLAVTEGSLPPECEIEANPTDKRGPAIREMPRGRWRIYRKPEKRHQYVLGVDLATGDPGGDMTPIVVLNRHTMDVDAVFYGKLPPDLMAREAAKVGWWYNEAQVAGEANNHGLLFFHELLENIEYHNVYYRLVSEESVAKKQSLKPGVWTSGKNREGLINLPRRYVRDRVGRCIDPNLIREWAELHYEDDTDKVNHPRGGYSDGTMAFAMALYVHQGSTEGTLEPLPLEMTNRAIAEYHSNRVRRSMGIPEKDIDIGRLTMDQIQKLDDMNERRDKSRVRSGLGGYR